jgi:hypothetical protein
MNFATDFSLRDLTIANAPPPIKNNTELIGSGTTDPANERYGF